MQDGFHGAKLILMLGSDLVVLRRDDDPGVAWPGCLDFPGGARRGTESPLECALRETFEETGLRIPPDTITKSLARRDERGIGWFFRADCPAMMAPSLEMGSEGQALFLMRPEDFLTANDAIPHFQEVLRRFIGITAPAGT